MENGEEIALKKLNQIGLDDKEFTNEFNNIIRVHHQNIVQFVGYCYHEERRCTEYNGQYVFALEAEGILCFEYLHGGDLERHLSGMTVLCLHSLTILYCMKKPFYLIYDLFHSLS